MSHEPAKLYYFRGRGRSQQARWALTVAKIKFENVTLTKSAEFDELCRTGKLTYQQVPMLEMGGRYISQSMAIVRHAARLGDLYGADAEEACAIDEVLDGITDARNPIVAFPFAQQVEQATRQLHNAVQRFFPCFELIAERNVANAPFMVGTRLSIADVLLAELVHSTSEAIRATYGDEAITSMLEPFKRLRGTYEHVLALPEISAFMAGPNWFAFPVGQVGKEYVRNVREVLN